MRENFQVKINSYAQYLFIKQTARNIYEDKTTCLTHLGRILCRTDHNANQFEIYMFVAKFHCNWLVVCLILLCYINE